MFLSNEALAGPILQPSVVQEKAPKKAVSRLDKLSPDERMCYVLNAVISQHGCLTLNVTHRHSMRIEPYHANTNTPFNGKTAFASETGKWILDICGTFYYPIHTEGFEKWVEASFQQLKNDPDVAIDQPGPTMTFSRVR